jgi:hypothetical protein
MEIYLKENMKKIDQVAMENLQIKMVQYIMDIGLMILNLELDMKYGMIHQHIVGNIITEKKKG